MAQNRIYIVAEMACSHEGRPDLARIIIDGAGRAGADAIQLQIWSLKHMMSPQRKEYDFLKRIEISQKEWVKLRDYVRTNYPEMQLYVCVYEHNSIEFIDSLDLDGYKLNSSDLSNPLVLDKIAHTGKPINLSIGASTISEIHAAIERIRRISEAKVTLMYGHQSFPTKPENINLSYISKIRKLFELPVGYQDHCDGDSEAGFWLPAASMGMRVNVIEKHITHDRSKKGVDHESALNPDEFVKFVEMIRLIDVAKGCSTPRSFSDDEIKYRQFQKKSIVAVRDLNNEHVLTGNDITFMRAEKLGLSPNKFEKLIGKTLKHDIDAYEIIDKGDVK